MAKRKKKSGNGNASNKRPRNNNNDNRGGGLMAGNPHGYLDQATGQHGAFPGLHQDEKEPFLGPAYDGLSYLRMVRSEAALVPSLLLGASVARPELPKLAPLKPRMTVVQEESVDTLDYDDPPAAAPELNYDDHSAMLNYDDPTSILDDVSEEKEEEELYEGTEDAEDASEDQNYYFAESTYISRYRAPTPPPPPPHHHSLLDRFRALRLALRLTPPPPLNPAPKFPRTFSYAWVNETAPTPSMLWSMDQPRVIRMIGGLGHQIGTGTRTVRRGVERRVGEWAWGLLLRVDEAMIADEVGTVREMGKISMGVWKKLRELRKKGQLGIRKDVAVGEGDDGVLEEAEEMTGPEAEVEKQDEDLDEVAEEGKDGETDNAAPEGVPDGVAVPTSAAATEKEAESTAAPSSSAVPGAHDQTVEVDWNYTIATLDMIISIVGDFFGQRDLLEERSAIDIR